MRVGEVVGVWGRGWSRRAELVAAATFAAVCAACLNVLRLCDRLPGERRHIQRYILHLLR